MALVHKDVKETKTNKDFVSDGRIFEDNVYISLFDPVPLPVITLSPEQFIIPDFAIIKAPRTTSRKAHSVDGKKIKYIDDNGQEVDEVDGQDVVVTCVDAELAQTVLDGGGTLAGLPTIELNFDANSVTLQDFEIDKIIKVKKGNVRLGWTQVMGKPSCTRIFMDVEEYEVD